MTLLRQRSKELGEWSTDRFDSSGDSSSVRLACLGCMPTTQKMGNVLSALCLGRKYSRAPQYVSSRFFPNLRGFVGRRYLVEHQSSCRSKTKFRKRQPHSGAVSTQHRFNKTCAVKAGDRTTVFQR